MNKHAGVKKIIADSAVVASSEREPRTLNLALQGGGAHGAFTWGVLDRLLDEPN
ncbi:patatin-like phospholipase family protein, partial [Rhizobium sp. 25PS6]|nr:patatin-like phospholipase family protein [Rhizobium sp. 25PS6]